MAKHRGQKSEQPARSSRRKQYREDIDGLLGHMKKLNPGEPLAGELSRYLCIRIAGYGEVAVSELCEEYAVGFSDNEFLTTYVWSTARGATNPDARKLKVLFSHFDSAWGERVTRHFERESAEREAWKTVMLHRNRIAHGEASDISTEQLKGYLEQMERTLTWLDGRLKCHFKA